MEWLGALEDVALHGFSLRSAAAVLYGLAGYPAWCLKHPNNMLPEAVLAAALRV